MVTLQSGDCYGSLPQKTETHCFHMQPKQLHWFITGQLSALENNPRVLEEEAMMFHCESQLHHKAV